MLAFFNFGGGIKVPPTYILPRRSFGAVIWNTPIFPVFSIRLAAPRIFGNYFRHGYGHLSKLVQHFNFSNLPISL